MSAKRKHEDEKETPYKRVPAHWHWSHGLLASMKDTKLVVKKDEKVVAIKDKYPKAEYHYLVLPKEDISSLAKVTIEHLPILKHMQQIGQELTGRNPQSCFKLGYHARASMIRLHLHVISDDFISPHLKSKKHWNTFTTGFFIPSKDIIKQVEENGKVKLLSPEKVTQYMNSPLKCHKCTKHFNNVPSLKRHLVEHKPSGMS